MKAQVLDNPIRFAQIDLRDHDLITSYRLPATKTNLELMIQMSREYLDGLVALQEGLRTKYLSKFETNVPDDKEIDEDKYDELRSVTWEKKEYQNLFYT